MAGVNGHHHDDWRDLLLMADGKIRERCAQNALILFEHHPEVGPSLGFNVFAGQAVAIAALPWDDRGLAYPRQLNNEDSIRSLGWLERQGVFKLSSSTAWSALVAASSRRKFNPLVNWLQGLAWDGTKRINHWLSYYLGAELTPYIESISAKFLISAVARAFKPGCKVDTMPVFEGAQGIKKSTALRILFGSEYYSDELADFGSKDAALQMQGKWCIEVAELATFGRADVRRVKEVLSRQVDRFRAPYDRSVAEHPRQCVLAGTTNPVDGYFKDPTGGRRFWPVPCGSIDADALAQDRDQLWAEAVSCYESGEKWWLQGDEIPAAKVEQEARQESDPWDDIVADHVVGRAEITATEILAGPLKIEIAKQGKMEQMRVANILTHLGWRRTTVRRNGKAKKVWLNTGELPLGDGGNAGGNGEGVD